MSRHTMNVQIFFWIPKTAENNSYYLSTDSNFKYTFFKTSDALRTNILATDWNILI